MTFAEHPIKGNKADRPKGGIKATSQVQKRINLKENVWGYWKFLSRWLTLDMLNTGKKGLKGAIVPQRTGQVELFVQNADNIKIIWNRGSFECSG